MNVIIRSATPEDAAVVSKIITASWKTAYRGMIPQDYLDRLNEDERTPRLRKSLSDGTMKAVVLFENGIPAGAVGYGESRDENLADWGEVRCIYIQPRFFRKGYGSKLLRTALGNLKKTGYPGCFLWVLAENESAQKFYAAMGFEKADDVCHSEIGGERQTEIRYKIRLN